MTEKVIEKRRLASPATTPQALAWDSRNKTLWMGSRDLRRIYAIDPEKGKVKYRSRGLGTIGKASLVFADGKIYFCEGNGRYSKLTCFGSKRGDGRPTMIGSLDGHCGSSG